jgi:hypothetical protein
MQAQLSASSVTVPFDNTNGFNTGVALGTLSGLPSTLVANFLDNNGNSFGSAQTISLASGGHTSFMTSSRFPFTANTSGIMKVVGGAGLIGVGLRASPYGTLTALPVPVQ